MAFRRYHFTVSSESWSVLDFVEFMLSSDCGIKLHIQTLVESCTSTPVPIASDHHAPADMTADSLAVGSSFKLDFIIKRLWELVTPASGDVTRLIALHRQIGTCIAWHGGTSTYGGLISHLVLQQAYIGVNLPVKSLQNDGLQDKKHYELRIMLISRNKQLQLDVRSVPVCRCYDAFISTVSPYKLVVVPSDNASILLPI